MIKSIDNIYTNNRTNSIYKKKNWQYETVRFTGFQVNPAGLTLTNEIDKVLCAGKQAEKVRAIFLQLGYADCIIKYLQKRTENKKMREPSFVKLENEVIENDFGQKRRNLLN